MNLTMPDALVILGILGSIMTAYIKRSGSGNNSRDKPDTFTCPAHSGTEQRIHALESWMTDVDSKLDKKLDEIFNEITALKVALATKGKSSE